MDKITFYWTIPVSPTPEQCLADTINIFLPAVNRAVISKVLESEKKKECQRKREGGGG